MIRFVTLLQALRRDIAVLLFAMLRRDTPTAVKVLFPLALLYLISPIDIIPDAIPVFGALDDAVREETERRVTRYGTIVFIASIVVLVLWIAILVWALSKVFA